MIFNSKVIPVTRKINLINTDSVWKLFRWVFIVSVLLPGLNFLTATAHPHMFIDVMVKFVLSDTALNGFYVFWEFDEMSSASMADAFDKNHNKVFEKEECSIIEGSLPYLAASNFYLVCTWEKQSLTLKKIEKFAPVFRTKSKIMYSFFVPCNLTLSQIADKQITLFFEDPSMLTAFQIQKDRIQVTRNPALTGTISFGKRDYNECIYLTVKATQ